MTVYTTYNQEGIKEDVSDMITNIDPTDTPMFTMMRTEKVHNRTFNWQEDSHDPPVENAQLEGDNASYETLTPTEERENSTQIFHKAFQISETADAVATYGRAKETAYQLAKKLIAIKLDLERAFIGVDNDKVTGGSSTKRKMASVSKMISTTVDAGGSATDPLTEDKLLELGEDCYNNGSKPSVLMIKPADSRIVSNFAYAAGRNRELAQGRRLVNVVDLYVSPYGEYKVIMNRHQLTTHAFLIDPAMFKTCVLRPFARTLLAKLGDADNHFIRGEYSVKHNSFADSGMITGLS